jgi:transposase
MVERHLDGIRASGDKPISLGSTEGSNVKARHIIRQRTAIATRSP